MTFIKSCKNVYKKLIYKLWFKIRMQNRFIWRKAYCLGHGHQWVITKTSLMWFGVENSEKYYIVFCKICKYSNNNAYGINVKHIKFPKNTQYLNTSMV